jgi:hypothetical protein
MEAEARASGKVDPATGHWIDAGGFSDPLDGGEK